MADGQRLAELDDPASDRAMAETDLRDQVQHLMARLEQREREVLVGRYGLSDSRISQTCQELGDRLQLSRQRIVQIEQQAMSKLRQLAKQSHDGLM
jgi:RNA polymerase sigma factor (sigma-70 family)